MPIRFLTSILKTNIQMQRNEKYESIYFYEGEKDENYVLFILFVEFSVLSTIIRTMLVQNNNPIIHI
jgi:hypothetical protein